MTTTLSTITPAAVDAFLPVEVLERPLRLGHYQVAVLIGDRAWSGADLAGEAQRWSAHYKRSRFAALEKVQAALEDTGVDLDVEKRAHGKLVLVWRVAGLTVGQWAAAAERPGLAGMVPA